MAFTPTEYVDDSTPAITAHRLNEHQAATKANETAVGEVEQRVADARRELDDLLDRIGAAEATLKTVQKTAEAAVAQSEVTSNATPNTVAKRGSKAQVAVSDVPPFDSSATSKKYVDSQVKAVADRVAALESAAAAPAGGDTTPEDGGTTDGEPGGA